MSLANADVFGSADTAIYNTASHDLQPTCHLEIPASRRPSKGGKNYETWSSGLRDAFESNLKPGFFANYTHYSKVEVLLLSWETEFDDLQVDPEIAELCEVFTNDYHFNCVRKKIKPSRKTTAQLTLSSHVVKWLEEKDDDELGTLFILYFAGHGTASKARPGDLVIRGNSSPLDVRRYLSEVVWNHTENLLHQVQGDVLQIFDCCYAGSIKRDPEPPRRVEFLGASKSTTKGPSDQSFTKALIWALKDFARNGHSFTSLSLMNKIKTFPSFPPEQEPVLYDRRGGSDDGRILLRPLGKEPASVTKPFMEATKRDPHADIITLKLVSAGSITERQVATLAEDLSHTVYHKKLNISRIVWAYVKPQSQDQFFNVASRFRMWVRDHRKSSVESHDGPQFVPKKSIVRRTSVVTILEDLDKQLGTTLPTIESSRGINAAGQDLYSLYVVLVMVLIGAFVYGLGHSSVQRFMGGRMLQELL